MSFMQQQVTEKTDWLEIDGTSGITFVPSGVLCKYEWDVATGLTSDDEEPEDLQAIFGDYYDGKIWSVTTREGYGARLSAPGYMDCTEWGVFDTVPEAEDYLTEMYGEDED